MERLDLHPNDGVDEEEHGNEQDDVRQSLNEKQTLLFTVFCKI